MLVQAGTLPKTSSGKLQRAKCREQYLDRGARGSGWVAVKVVYTDAHLLHDPHAEIEASTHHAAVRAHRPGAGDPRRARPPIRRSRSWRRRRGAPRRSRPCTIPTWCASCRPPGPSTRPRCRARREVFAEVFYRPGIRRAMTRRAVPESIVGRLGWYCFETTTPLTETHLRGVARRGRHRADARRSWCSTASRSAYGLCRPPGPPRQHVELRRLLLLQQRGDRRPPRRRRPPARRSPCSTSTTTTATARRRSSTTATTCSTCRCTATRSGPTRSPSASPTRPAPGGGAVATCNIPLAGKHRRRRVRRAAGATGSRRDRSRSARRC